MKIENILPIGTVIQLKEIDVRIMICGYCSEQAEYPNYVWDYAGFLFPIGYTSKKMIVSFDAEQIQQIITYGFQDEEQIKYMEELAKVMETIEKGTKEA